jgi:hypothetical protein
MTKRILRWLVPLLLVMCFVAPTAVRAADVPEQQNDGAQVMAEFQKDQKAEDGANRALSDKDKRRVLFLLGVPLLICLIITAGLGVAMVVYGKSVFKAHMIFAGLSLSLAGAHVVAALVWFLPW